MRILLLLCWLALCVLKVRAEDIHWNERPGFAVVYDDVLREYDNPRVFRRMMGEFFLTFDEGINQTQMVAFITADGQPLAGYTSNVYEDWVHFQAPRAERLRQLECPSVHDDLMAELRAIDGIRHVSPALLGTNSNLKRMPKFQYFVALKEGADPAQVFGNRSHKLFQWPSTYELSAEGSSWRQMRRELNLLTLDSRVNWAEPRYWAEAIGLSGAGDFQSESSEFFNPVPSCLPKSANLSIKTDPSGATITVNSVAERIVTIQQLTNGTWQEVNTRLGGNQEEFKVNLAPGSRIFRALAY